MSRIVSSPYIEWAKLSSSAPVNLATSGVPHLSLADLDATLDDAQMALPPGHGYGSGPLVERIAATYGVTTECVVTAAGTSMANYLAMATLIDPGDEVVVERPTSEPLLGAMIAGGVVARVDRRPADHFGLDPDDVRRAITTRTRLVVLANLHNPSGQLVPETELRAIGDAAAAVGARVLVDEVYLDAVFEDTPPSCVHLGPQFVSTNSLTKIYGLSGLRCGWILAEPRLAHRMWRLNDLFANVDAHPAQRLGVRAFERLAALRARSRALIDENRRRFEAMIAGRPDIALARAAWGTTACLRPAGGRADALVSLLRDRFETSVVPGRFFELPDHVRVSLCAPPDVGREGFARLAAALDALPGA